jgi:hypothetical protein
MNTNNYGGIIVNNAKQAAQTKLITGSPASLQNTGSSSKQTTSTANNTTTTATTNTGKSDDENFESLKSSLFYPPITPFSELLNESFNEFKRQEKELEEQLSPAFWNRLNSITKPVSYQYDYGTPTRLNNKETPTNLLYKNNDQQKKKNRPISLIIDNQSDNNFINNLNESSKLTQKTNKMSSSSLFSNKNTNENLSSTSSITIKPFVTPKTNIDSSNINNEFKQENNDLNATITNKNDNNYNTTNITTSTTNNSNNIKTNSSKSSEKTTPDNNKNIESMFAKNFFNINNNNNNNINKNSLLTAKANSLNNKSTDTKRSTDEIQSNKTNSNTLKSSFNRESPQLWNSTDIKNLIDNYMKRENLSRTSPTPTIINRNNSLKPDKSANPNLINSTNPTRLRPIGENIKMIAGDLKMFNKRFSDIYDKYLSSTEFKAQNQLSKNNNNTNQQRLQPSLTTTETNPNINNNSGSLRNNLLRSNINNNSNSNDNNNNNNSLFRAINGRSITINKSMDLSDINRLLKKQIDLDRSISIAKSYQNNDNSNNSSSSNNNNNSTSSLRPTNPTSKQLSKSSIIRSTNNTFYKDFVDEKNAYLSNPINQEHNNNENNNNNSNGSNNKKNTDTNTNNNAGEVVITNINKRFSRLISNNENSNSNNSNDKKRN